MKLTFSEFSIDSETFELHVGDQSVAIDERNVALLSILAQRYPEHCSKQECLDLIWQETVVSDMSLSKLVSDTRKLFSKAGYQGPLIQTVHGRGYRLEHVLGKQVIAQAQSQNQNQNQNQNQSQSQSQEKVSPQRGAVDSTDSDLPLTSAASQKTNATNWFSNWENFAKVLILLLLTIGLVVQIWHVTSSDHDKPAATTLSYSEPKGSIGRILWVDDHPENNLVEKAYFEQKNIGVYNTVTSQEALMLLSMYNYQTVISDMGRHGDSLAGLKLLQAIRAEGNNTPFYLYTYVESPGLVDAIYESGGQAVVLDSESLYKLVLSQVEQQ
ncbi:winged helix-turn-helix domain-containing protein [Shewanella sp. Isolate13]|uniref:winged helix-turn-helix domain-containing protein n=1 Tax=Shewanella sp. Isolate13 TaxID=2908531 RepID=UPI001EFE66E8|nr:winged helix-turn-helix domain-containing protein [Shewanella sp. Isolate13]MCG9728252.1 winged helix-turn-helix domain-containing protein [Shewanella sp. Isolate13]